MRQRPGLDFVRIRGWFYLFSFLILLPGAISLLIPPRLVPGIDFTGGSEFTVRFQEEVSKDELSGVLQDLDHPEARIQGTGENEFLVRTKELQGEAPCPPIGPCSRTGTEQRAIENRLVEEFGPLLDGQGGVIDRFLESSLISETVSREIRLNATYALLAAAAAIFLFLWWSFRSVPQSFRFGTAAVIALLHDALLVVGIFSILGKVIGTEINVMFITALLTVIGFSVHDSIVVFDRIRETVVRGEWRTFAEAVNVSLLQTLARSLNTSLTLIFAILALMLMGGDSIREFLWAILIGTVVGAYSSIFIAAQVLVSWEEGDVPRLFRRLLGRPEPQEDYSRATVEG